MKKQIIVIIICTIIFFLYVHLSQLNSISFTLSERTKEYLTSKGREYLFTKNKQKETNLFPFYFNPETSQHQLKTNCYQLQLPFEASNIEKINDCNRFITFKKPAITIAIVVRENQNSLSELPDIQMRRFKKSEYKEDLKIVGENVFLTFVKKSITYEKSGFIVSQKYIMSITVNGISNQNFDSIFDFVIASLQIIE